MDLSMQYGTGTAEPPGAGGFCMEPDLEQQKEDGT